MDGHKKLQRKITKRQEIISLRLHDLTKHLFDGHYNGLEDYYHLEDKWTDIVNVNIQVYMTNKKKLQQRAIWEFLVTEKNYINKLRLIMQVFLQSFVLIRSEGELQDVHQKEIFGNINEVFLSNDAFWTNHLQPVLERSSIKKTPIVPSELFACLLRADQVFGPYLQFCILQDGCLKNIRNVMEQGECKNMQINLKSWLAWCKSLPHSGKTNLVDLMTEPMQRLTRYPILLKRIHQETTDKEEMMKVGMMVKSAERFVYNVNKAIRTKEEKLRLELCLKEFDYYSVMDAGYEEVKWIAVDFLRLNVQGLPVDEPRCILKQAPMKIIEKKGKTEQEIELFLFTDLIALARMRRSTNKLTIIRQLYYLDKVKLLKTHSSETGIVFIYLDEAGLLATTFVLEVSNNEREYIGNDRERRKKDVGYERDVWVSTILKAKKIYEKARNGQGSTLDYFQEETYKPEPESKIISSKPIGFAKSYTMNTYGYIGISLDDKNKQNGGGLPPSNRYNGSLPSSLIPDDPTVTWVLRNKEERGSIPSDLNNESIRLGEKFKCNESECDVVLGSDSGVSIRSCSSVPELANVERLCANLQQSFDVLEENVEDDICAQRMQDDRTGNLYDNVVFPSRDTRRLVDAQTQTNFRVT